MKYYIYDPQKNFFHIYGKYIVFQKLTFLDKNIEANNLNIIYVATKLSHFYNFIKFKNNNDVILVIENPILKKKFLSVKKNKFYRLNELLENFD